MDDSHRLRAAHGYFELGMHEEARWELDSVPREERTEPDWLHLKIQLLLSDGGFREALALSRQLCDRAPEFNPGYIHAAYCLHELGRTEEARDTLVDGPESLREDPLFFYNLGCYEVKLGLTDSARARLERSFEMDPALRRQATRDPDLSEVWRELIG